MYTSRNYPICKFNIYSLYRLTIYSDLFFTNCTHRMHGRNCYYYESRPDQEPKIFRDNEKGCPICKTPVMLDVITIPNYKIDWVYYVSNPSFKMDFEKFVKYMCESTKKFNKVREVNYYDISNVEKYQTETFVKFFKDYTNDFIKFRKDLVKMHQILATMRSKVEEHNIKCKILDIKLKPVFVWTELIRSIRYMLLSAPIYDFKANLKSAQLWTVIYKLFRLENYINNQNAPHSKDFFKISFHKIDGLYSRENLKAEQEVFSKLSWHKFYKILKDYYENEDIINGGDITEKKDADVSQSKFNIASVDQLYVDALIFANMINPDDKVTIQLIDHINQLMYQFKTEQMKKRGSSMKNDQMIAFLKKVLMMRLLADSDRFQHENESDLERLTELETQGNTLEEQIEILTKILGLKQNPAINLLQKCYTQIRKYKKEKSSKKKIIVENDAIDDDIKNTVGKLMHFFKEEKSSINYLNNSKMQVSGQEEFDLDFYPENDRVNSYALEASSRPWKADSYLVDEKLMTCTFIENLANFDSLKDIYNLTKNSQEVFRKIMISSNLINSQYKYPKLSIKTSVDHLLYQFNKDPSFRFIAIAKKYSDFYKKYISHSCTYCSYKPRLSDMAVCLACGAVICIGRCSDVRRSKYESHRTYFNLCNHVHEEHAGSSVFINIMKGSYIIYSDLRWFEYEYLYSDKFGLGVRDYNFIEVDRENFEFDEVELEKLRLAYLKHGFLDMIVQAKRKYKKVMRWGDA